MKKIKLSLLALAFAYNLQAQNTFPATGNVGIGVASPTSALHIVGTEKLTIGTPDVNGTVGAALTSSELRFRTADNYYMALAQVPYFYEMQFINKNTGTLAGFKSDYIKLNSLLSVDNFKVADVQNGTLFVGGSGYPSGGGFVATPFVVKAHNNSPALNIYNPAAAFIKSIPFDPSNITTGHATMHLQPADVTEGYATGITFGSSAAGYESTPEAGIYTQFSNAYGTKMFFATTNSYANGPQSRMVIDNLGNLGVGTNTPNAKLDVNGNIFSNGKILVGTTDLTKAGTHSLAVNGSAIFTKALVKLNTNWPDYVFEPSYPLLNLSEVESYLLANKHLPGVPSAVEVADKGIDLGDNQAILLKKVEELTLYAIEANKKAAQQMQLIKTLQEEVAILKKHGTIKAQ